MSNFSLRGYIDLEQIPKDKIITSTRNGIKRRFVNIDIVGRKVQTEYKGHTTTHFAKIRQTEEENAAGEPILYIGNFESFIYTKDKRRYGVFNRRRNTNNL